MSAKTCPKTGKRQYKNAPEADRAVAHWLRLANPAFEATAQSVYRCEYCHKWHMTSCTPEISKRIQDAKRRAWKVPT